MGDLFASYDRIRESERKDSLWEKVQTEEKQRKGSNVPSEEPAKVPMPEPGSAKKAEYRRLMPPPAGRKKEEPSKCVYQ